MAETTGEASPEALMNGLGATTLKVLKEARSSGVSTVAVAEKIARERIKTVQ